LIRVGGPRALAPSLEGLVALRRAHCTAIPFEIITAPSAIPRNRSHALRGNPAAKRINHQRKTCNSEFTY